MVAIQIEAQVTLDELLKAVSRLSSPDLEEFVQHVLLLRAERRAPVLPEAETELLLKINQGLPEELWRRYNRLIAKRKAETLTPGEHADLVRLSDEIDAMHARRMEALSMNRRSLVNLRRVLHATGEHPPQDPLEPRDSRAE